MNKLLNVKPLWAFAIFIPLDLFCVAMGMGVPIFCILLGFISGWFIVRYITATTSQAELVFQRVFWYALITAAFTLLVMLILWTPFATSFLDPSRDLANSGIPMILYEPRASFIGWIALMILISPFLQLLTTLFSAYLTLWYWLEKRSTVKVPSSVN